MPRSRDAIGMDDNQLRLDLGELTVRELAARWLDEHTTQLAARTRRTYEQSLRIVVLPHLGDAPVSAVKRAHVLVLHATHLRQPAKSNLALVVTRMIFAFAEDRGLRPVGSNPCARIRPHATRRRGRPLELEETRKLVDVLEHALELGVCEAAMAAAFLLIVHTGARREEVMRLRWREVDFAHRELVLERHKTARHMGTKRVPLCDDAVQLLEAQPTEGEHVFPGKVPGAPIRECWHAWKRVCEAAGLSSEVRLHDVRGGWATAALEAGVDLRVVQNQLGHSSIVTTSRYVRVTPSTSQRAVELVAARLRKRGA